VVPHPEIQRFSEQLGGKRGEILCFEQQTLDEFRLSL
jgi:hypothetical protein